MSGLIHGTAVVDPAAQIDSTSRIGAYSVIGEHVKIGANTEVGPHVTITGYTTIGSGNHIFQFTSLGDVPQDKKYHGEKAELIIGNDNAIREYCSINAGCSEKTIIGNDNWIMAYVHIAHDCQIGNHTVFVNGATLAGHVEVGSYATIGAFTKVHQFCRIGEYSFTREASVGMDLIPYTIAVGSPAKTYGLNKIGLKRNGFSEELIQILHRCYVQLIRRDSEEGPKSIDVEKYAATYPEVKKLLDFIKSSDRGVMR